MSTKPRNRISSQPGISIGLFSIGLDTYWPQFDGLYKRLCGFHDRIQSQLSATAGVRVIDAGMVDTPEKGRSAAQLFGANRVDLIFLYISTYALSSTVLPAVQKAGVPVILLNLQPSNAINYAAFNALGDRGKMTSEWLAHCQACSVPEIACVFNRAGITYDIVTGTLDDPAAWTEITEWVAAGNVHAQIRNNRVGIVGHYYSGMLDVYTDVTRQAAVFGSHFEWIEMCEIREHRDALATDDVERKLAEFHDCFQVSDECETAELLRAARTSCALDKMVERHMLGSCAYYYEGSQGNEYEDIVTSVIAGNSLLTMKGVPVAGECEIKNVQAMKIMDSFGAGGSFSEFYGLDFNTDVVLLGHDGPGHAAIAQEKIRLVPLPLFHGKPGKGLSIEMQVKHGPVTLLSVVEHRDGTIKFLVAQGESINGPILQIGNTNSHYKFPISAKAFIDSWSKAGPSHHCAIGTGHIATKLEKLACLFGLELLQIC